jgi:hypothetical protein
VAFGVHGRWRKFLTVVGVAVVGFAILATILLAKLSPLSRGWSVGALSRYYDSNATLEDLHVTLFPHITVSGAGLVLKQKARPGGPPLASVRRFLLEATWPGLLLRPPHVQHLVLEGLVLNVPPRQAPGGPPGAPKKHHLPPIYFDDIAADGAELNTFSHDPKTPPRVFAFSQLHLQAVGVGRPMTFQAMLTNPKPIGEIQTSGKFGPWNPDAPDETPVAGHYTFQNADLATIRGLAGTLSSEGAFQGVLDRIDVDGSTDTPQFSLGPGHNAEPLRTTFHAIVDGESGQTLLQPVRAVLGRSLIVARGGVLRKAGEPGTTVQLDVVTNDARLADVLGLAVKSSHPPITGLVSVRTQLEVLPGPEELEKRLGLNGSFTIDRAHFTDPAVEEKVTHLSRRAEGSHGPDDGQAVASNFRGRFVLASGVMSFSSLSFDVPGAAVNLHGTYGLLSEQLNFLGTLDLEAKLSQMTTGWKATLLKGVDPLFRGENAGTEVPIRIFGDRQHPSFSVQYHAILKRLGL